jgi:hypothetical protein
MNGSAQCGSRAATRVRILSGRWSGRVGVVVREVPGPGTVMVRFERDGRPIPFGRCEVEIVKGMNR